MGTVGSLRKGAVVEVLELYVDEGDAFGRVGSPTLGWILVCSMGTHYCLPRSHFSTPVAPEAAAAAGRHRAAGGGVEAMEDPGTPSTEDVLENAVVSRKVQSQPYASLLSGTGNARECLGPCLICYEPLDNDPREVINLCSKQRPCMCLLHRRCYFNKETPMNDHLRKCMICGAPGNRDLVRQRVKSS
eukprot:NODE_3527_length_773_cov_501.036212.p1 GENE.NODE_3527_length_773_cov_501.036212~~NODE_3527_length_773_cov_501.036212.p1  ORF type:complete len:188 (-),score=30.22 NODE_3527_length_773_cov_501.036212:192-755(-)